jgi:Tol biopolymer transport system component
MDSSKKDETPADSTEEIHIEGDQPLTPEPSIVEKPVQSDKKGEDVDKKEILSEQKEEASNNKPKAKRKFWPPTKKQLLIVGGVFVVVLLIIAVIQPVRNAVAGLVLKTSATIEAYDEFTDSETGKTERIQLTDLTIKIDGKTVAAKAISPIKVSDIRPGSRTVSVSKGNYKTFTTKLQANLKFGQQNNTGAYKLVATGRPVKVLVKNSISGDVLADASISDGKASAKTDTKGQAIVVLPVNGKNEHEYTLSKTGFLDKKIKLALPLTPSQKVTDLTLTPSGKVYFLSKQSGKIDVVKTNLDGSERETVLAGTGKEENTTTTLVATTDWRYLALHTRRSDKNYQLLLIDTKTDANTVIDEGNAVFELEGWSGKTLVYTVASNVLQAYQPGKYKIKSYNAESKSLKIVYQNQANGNSIYNYSAEYPVRVTVVSGRIIYDIEYQQAGYSFPPGQGTIRSAEVSGANTKTLHTYEPAKGYLELTYTSAKEVYYSFTEYAQGGNSPAVTYYEVDADGKFKQTKKPEKADQYTYLVSPDGTQTLWSEEQDGKQTIFVGDASGGSPKEYYRLSELKPYGWFTKDYALYSKNNSELYIAALKEKAEPKKISDYHRPSQVNFIGYGGGYGGAY